MSAFGTKRTCQSLSAMSAFGSKADIAKDPNYEGNLDIKNVVIPNPVQIKSRQIGIIVPKIILAGSHLGSAYSFHNLFFSKYGSLNLSFILLVTV